MLTDYINKAMSDAVFDKLKEYSVPQIKML
jgi:hypothetical protein